MERLPPDTPWMTAPSARAVIDALEAAGGRGCARFVGGCVRDTLLGRADEVTDVDIATPLTPPEVIAALKAAGLKPVPTGVEHGTITAVSDGKPYEVTTLRRDVETDGRRAVVAFTTDWAVDAQRRDFRLNALYADPDGTIHDPTGGGLTDVEARRIVFVGDPETRIREDYLRILRFFRFLARVGDAAEADPAGLAACAKLKGGIAELSGERIRQEIFKLLGARDPVPAVRLMEQTRVLDACGACLSDDGEKLGDLIYFQQVLGEAPDHVLRLATLISGLPDMNWQEAVSKASDRLRLSTADRTRLLLGWQTGRPLLVGQGAADIHRDVYRFGSQVIHDDALLRCANGDFGWDTLKLQIDEAKWSPPPFPITGADIKALGVPEGPQVGAIRKALEDWWIAGDFQATKAEALAELEALVRELKPS